MLSIASVVPFAKLITEKETKEVFFLFNLFSYNNQKDAIFFFATIFISLTFINAFSRCILIYFNHRLTNSVSAELSIDIFNFKKLE